MTTLTIETFAGRVGETFRVIVNEEWEIHMRLSAVTPWGPPPPNEHSRQPFSLRFHAPVGAVVPQRTFRVEHGQMEPFDLFLVPLGPDADGMRYEAIFS